MSSSQLIEYINVAGTVGTCVAAVLIFLQIRSDRNWDRLRTSHEILNEFVSGQIENALEFIEEKIDWDILHENRTYDQVVGVLAARNQTSQINELDRYLRRLFRRFEAICISMDNNIVREAICREYIFSILVKLCDSCEGFLAKERARRMEPKVFEFVELYARRWR